MQTNASSQVVKSTKLSHARRRSLGLSLLECASGRYPYDASLGPLQLMLQARHPSSPASSLSARCATTSEASRVQLGSAWIVRRCQEQVGSMANIKQAWFSIGNPRGSLRHLALCSVQLEASLLACKHEESICNG